MSESSNKSFKKNIDSNFENTIFTRSSESRIPLIKINVIVDENNIKELTLYQGENIEDSIQRFFKENKFNKETRSALKNELIKQLNEQIKQCIIYFNFNYS